MYATLQRLPCEPEEEHAFAIDSAKANAAQREAADALSLAERHLTAAEEELQMSVARQVLEAPRCAGPSVNIDYNPR